MFELLVWTVVQWRYHTWNFGLDENEKSEYQGVEVCTIVVKEESSIAEVM